jgi:hypothetical protein
MKRNILLIFLILCISITSIKSKCERNITTSLPTYIIDLDKEPSERFTQVVTDFKLPIAAWIDAEKYSFHIFIS